MKLEDENEEVSRYWITLRKILELERGSSRSHSGDLALEEAMDMS